MTERFQLCSLGDLDIEVDEALLDWIYVGAFNTSVQERSDITAIDEQLQARFQKECHVIIPERIVTGTLARVHLIIAPRDDVKAIVRAAGDRINQGLRADDAVYERTMDLATQEDWNATSVGMRAKLAVEAGCSPSVVLQRDVPPEVRQLLRQVYEREWDRS